MRGAQAGIHSELLSLRHVGFGHRCLFTGGNKFGQLRVLLGQRKRDRMFRGETDVGDAEQRIGPGGVHLDAVKVGNRRLQSKRQFHTATLTNPVPLHNAHGLWPAFQRIESLQ